MFHLRRKSLKNLATPIDEFLRGGDEFTVS